MCEPNRTPVQPHVNLVDAARTLLAQADQTATTILRPGTEIPSLYELAALLERRFLAVGATEPGWQPLTEKYLRAGAVEAARNVAEACRALERAWIAAYPHPRLYPTARPLPGTEAA